MATRNPENFSGDKARTSRSARKGREAGDRAATTPSGAPLSMRNATPTFRLRTDPGTASVGARPEPVRDGSDARGPRSRFVDCLLGGCHLVFHRGIVSTLALAALAGLFFFVPQTAEVLRNIRDDSLLVRSPAAPRLLFGHELPPWQFKGMDLLFVLTTLFTAMFLTFGTVVSGVIPAIRGTHMPGCFGSRSHLLRASLRFTIFVATAALLVMHGAFLQASVPAPVGVYQYAGWIAAVLPVAVTFVLRQVFRASDRHLVEPGSWRVRWPLLGGLLTVVLSTVAPAVLFELPVRAVFCNFAGISVAWLAYSIGSGVVDSIEEGAISEAGSAELWKILCGAPVLFPFALWGTPQDIIQSYGSGTLVLFQFIGLYCIGVLLIAGLRAWAKDVPGAALAGSAILLASLYFLVPERYGRESLTSSGGQAPFNAPLAKWHAARGGDFVAVHADGGGLRAAYFTAMVLAAADDATCGRFGSRVFALSGVSGGSLGIATWAMLRQELIQNRPAALAWPWDGCAAGTVESRLVAGGLQRLVENTLIRDHLTPVLASMVVADAVPAPWLSATRGQALLTSWQNAALDTLRRAGFEPSRSQAYARRLDRTTAGLDPAPWLVFSATDAATGERVMQVNSADPAERIAGAARPPEQTVLGLAALDSARFPYISPPGWAESASSPKARLLVDGGYYDNSGAASLLQLVKSVPNPPGTLHLVRLDGNPGSDEVRRCAVVLGEAQEDENVGGWAGLGAFLATRKAHADAAVQELQQLARADSQALMTTRYAKGIQLRLSYLTTYDADCRADDPGCRSRNARLCQEAIAYEAPLGWFLGKHTADEMQKSIRRSALLLVREAGFQ